LAFTVFEDEGVEALEGSAEAFKELKDQIGETGATAEGFSKFIKGLSSSAIAGAKQLKKFRNQGGANAVYAKLVE
jgi:hypothetical protein